MSNATPEQQLARIQAALFEGRKIEAIKLYRQATGVGLAEAKERIEAKEVQLRQSQHDGERGGLRNVGVTPWRCSPGRASTTENGRTAERRRHAAEVQLRQSQHDGERGGLRNVGVTPRRSSSGRASTAASRHSRPSPAALRWC